jgi:hypothetical protein
MSNIIDQNARHNESVVKLPGTQYQKHILKYNEFGYMYVNLYLLLEYNNWQLNTLIFYFYIFERLILYNSVRES